MNKSKKILMIFGTRPEAIKMVSLYKTIKDESRHQIKLCITAQHREMLDQVLSIFSVSPDYDLNLMKKNQTLFEITSNALNALKEVLEEYSPDLIFVHGDTTTTLAGALAGFYKNINVCHVEAGLRTYDFSKPYPEEMNRQLVSKLSHYHFCPTKISQQNLLNEGIKKSNILITGNTVIDTLNLARNLISKNKALKEKIKNSLENKTYKNLESSRYVLITGHRRESFGEGFKNICESISKLANENPDINFIYPVHLNPNVQKPVNKILSKSKNIFLIEPTQYLEFLHLMMNSFIILTDSGGIQEEGPSLGKPVLVMREVTERPEAIKAGTVKLVGSDPQKIYEGVNELINSKKIYESMAKSINPYGDGKANRRILKFINELK